MPLFVNERANCSDKDFPLIIGGGPCIHSNPLALLPFMDILCIGDIEPIVNSFIDFFIKNRELLPNFNKLLKQDEFERFKPLILIPNILISYLTQIYIENKDIAKLTIIKDLNVFPIKRI